MQLGLTTPSAFSKARSFDMDRLIATLLLLSASLALSSSADAASGGRTLLGSKDEVTLNILHFNDVHNRLQAQSSGASSCSRADDDAGKCFGGFARLTTAFKAARKLDPETLILDAGDQFSGSIFDFIYRGRETANLQNIWSIDAMTVGNHEFDWGPATLASYIKRVPFPVLGACNIDASRDPDLAGLLRKYVIKQVKGVKVAIYGVLTNETVFTSSPGPNITFSDPVTSMRACIREAKSKHKDIKLHIALTHIGYLQDMEMAASVQGLDLIVGGHSHTFLYSGTPPLLLASSNTSTDAANVGGPYPTYINTTLKTVPVVQAYYASRYVGGLQLTVDKRRGGIKVGSDGMPMISGKPMLLGGSASSNNVARDPVMDDLVQLYGKEVDALQNEVVGNTTVDLDSRNARVSETNIGALSATAFMDFYNTSSFIAQFGNIDFCIFNGGSIRASIAKGSITMGQVITVYPFGNTLAVARMNGTTIMAALEWGLSAVGSSSSTGRFPQVGGLRYVYDANRSIGMRLLSATTAAGEPIEPAKDYNVVTNSYMMGGGDGYVMMKSAAQVAQFGLPMEQVLSEYIKKHSPVSVFLDGRIIACQLTPTNPACTGAKTSSLEGLVEVERSPLGSILPYTFTLLPSHSN